ncbi:MFS family permease [Thermocatellispora tengchongensis]|uniref:MFS family permease n=1 Tax=Thermocatellispora tengchongensis TaxID=1073253 RepID=A0A840PGQ6_9ACTN|nr:MFS transporter [Thermocatellispora tengchongensis]MBB5138159.1 MFS family permease [Thermocatellispora tengchongensis]
MTAPSALDAPYTPAGIFARQYRAPTLGILLVITLIAFEGMSVVAVMPAVSADLNAIDLYGWSISAFLMAGLFVNVVAGLWSDRRGHALPFLLGVLVFVAGMALAGAATSKGLFIAARAVQGFGGGAVIVATYVMIARVYPPVLRPRVFALLAGAWVVPALVGPGLAGVISDTAGWRWVFFGIVPLVVPAVLMLLPALRAGGEQERTPAAGPRSRPLAMTLAAGATALGAGAVQYGVDNLHTRPLAGVPALVAGLAMLAFGVPRLLPPGAVRLRRGLPTTVVMRGLLSGAFFGVNSYIPLLLHDVRGFSTGAAGIALTTGALGWSAGSFLQSRANVDRARLIRPGAYAVTAGILLTALAAVPGVSGWIAVPAWIVAGFGMGLGISSVNVTAMRQSPDEEQGANSAALQVMDTLGSSLTIGLGGALINLIGHDAIGPAFVVITLLMTALGLVAALVAGRALDPR